MGSMSLLPDEINQIVFADSTYGSAVNVRLFMIAWQSLSTTCPRLKGWIDEGLKLAQKYYDRMDGNMTYILAMCK